MLDNDIKVANSKKDFEKNCKEEFFVNMTKSVRTLHKKDNPSCHYSGYAFEYIPFKTLKDVERYEEKHADATPFKRCGNCFKKRN
jgi:hypothetical protein